MTRSANKVRMALQEYSGTPITPTSRKVTPERADPPLMSVVRLLRPTSKDAPQAKGGDVDRGIDLSYNRGGLGKGPRLLYKRLGGNNSAYSLIGRTQSRPSV